jgi:hypothetical protein
VDWINPTGVKKVHSSIDKVFNLVELIPSLASRRSLSLRESCLMENHRRVIE